MFDITAFGEILIDFTRWGETAEGQALFARNPGGAPANVAVCAARLGAKTAFIGKVGRDIHGQFLRSVLEREGVDARGLLTDEDCFTTLAFVDVDEGGERGFSFARKPGADTRISADELPGEVLEQSKILHVGSLSLTHEPARGATLAAVERAKAAGAVIAYDPNYRPSLWGSEGEAAERMRSLLLHADMVKLSHEETLLLTGESSPEGAARVLHDRGVAVAAVTLGAEGAYVSCRGGGRYVPAFPCKAADTTGAGDAFWGGFLYRTALLGRRPEELELNAAAEFARFGNAVASLCVEQSGAIPAMPTMAQVGRRLSGK